MKKYRSLSVGGLSSLFTVLPAPENWDGLFCVLLEEGHRVLEGDALRGEGHLACPLAAADGWFQPSVVALLWQPRLS